MSRASPETFARTAEQGRAEAIRDLQDRMARVERGGGSIGGSVTIVQQGGGGSVVDATPLQKGVVQLAGHLAGTAAAPTIATTATPQVQRFGVGRAAGATTAIAAQTAAATDRLLDDTVHGLFVGVSGTYPEGQRYEIRHGSPTTVEAPTYRMSRYSNWSAPLDNGSDFTRYAAMQIWHQVTDASRAQPIAGLFYSISNATSTPQYAAGGGGAGASINTDAMGFQAVGQVGVAGTGRGIGGTVGGRTQSTVATSGSTGQEMYAENLTGVNDFIPVDGTSFGSRTMGIWLHPGQSTQTVAAGIQFGRQAGNIPFHTGIYFNKTGGGQGDPVSDASIRDDGASNYGLLIKGVKATAAIGIAAGAGHVGVGTTTPLHPLHVLRSSAGVIARFQNIAAATTSVVVDALAGQQALIQFQEGNQPAWGMGMQATGKQFILTDEQTGFIPITITPVDGTHIYRTQLITDRLIQDQTHGVLVGEGVAGLRWNICHGFNPNSTAVDVEGPTVRVNRRSHYGTPVVSGAEYERYGAFQVWHRASIGSTAQPIAGVFSGHSDSEKIEQYGAGPPGGFTVAGVTADPANTVITVTGHELLTGNFVYIAGVTGTGNIADVNGLWTLTRIDNNTFTIPVATTGAYTSGGTITVSINPDAMGLAAVGKVTGAGRGRGIGLTASGSTSSTNAVSGAMGAEVEAANSTGSDDAVVNNGIGSRTMGIWLHAGQGTNRIAAGIQFGRQGSQGFHTGIYFMGAGPQGNPTIDSSIRDDGNALTSIAINGPRSGSAIQIAAGAGAIGVTATAAGRSATAGLHVTNAGVMSISRSTSVAQVYLQCYSSSDGTNTATRLGIQSNTDGSVRLRFGDGTGTISELYKVVGSLVLKTSHQFEVASILTVGSTMAHNGTQLGFYTKTPVNQPAALTARVAAITDNSGGTPSDTVADAPTLYSESWAADTVATLIAKITNQKTRIDELESKLNMSSGGVGLLAGTT